jgi:hypothetical protein
VIIKKPESKANGSRERAVEVYIIVESSAQRERKKKIYHSVPPSYR